MKRQAIEDTEVRPQNYKILMLRIGTKRCFAGKDGYKEDEMLIIVFKTK